jgi:hypothetical protein
MTDLEDHLAICRQSSGWRIGSHFGTSKSTFSPSSKTLLTIGFKQLNSKIQDK